ncbi:MAG: glycosyltransferase [Thermoplasmatales archaeon]
MVTIEKRKKMILFDYLTPDEVIKETHPNAFALNSIIREANRNGQEVEYVQYSELGFYGLIARIAKRVSSGTDVNRRGKLGFIFTGLFYLSSVFIAGIDFSLRRKIAKILVKEPGDKIVIVSYPFLLPAFKKACRSYEYKIEIVLLELNIEVKYICYNIGSLANTVLGRSLLNVLEEIEFKSIYLSDRVLTLSERDRRYIAGLFPEKKVEKIPVYRPEIDLIVSFPNTFFTSPAQGLGPTNGKLKIFFIGSNYRLNYDSVEDLIKVSRSLLNVEDRIDFFIIGNVYRAFQHRADLPRNIHFLGFVEDLQSVFSFSDLFYMEDGMNTGFESKFYSYIRFQRPIIVLKGRKEEYKNFEQNQIICLESIEHFRNLLLQMLSVEIKKKNSTVYRLPSQIQQRDLGG